jgi:hypothetical protein
MKIKFNYLFFTIAAFAISSTIFCMDPSSSDSSPEKDKKKIAEKQKSKKTTFGKIKQNLKESLTHFFSENPQKTKIAIQEIKRLSQEEEQEILRESSILETPRIIVVSPREKYSVQKVDLTSTQIISPQAIGLLIATMNAKSLQEAGDLISSLTLINKEFYELLNERNLCLQIIKYLSARFNCSNIVACSVLKTEKAKYLLERQIELFKFAQKKENFSLNDNVVITGIYLQGADLEFTYDYAKDIATALIISLLNESELAQILITLGANINIKSKNGLTPLEIVQESGNIKFLEFIDKGEYTKIPQNIKKR